MDFFDILLAKKLNGGGGGDIDLQTLNVTENGTVNAPSGVAYNKVITNVPAPSNAIYKQTLSGLPSSIASFVGADAPLDSLKASIVGQQDLHGYDKPWVGGAGVNKWDEQWEQGGINTADGTNQGASCIRSVNYIPVSSDSYYFYMGTDAQLYIYAYDENKTYIGTYYNGSYVKTGSVTNVKGTAITFPSNVKFIRFRTNTAYGTTYNNDIAINYPSTVTTYSPYSNICPISGWTSCEVTDNNDTYTIQFKDSSDNPLTVYYGHIDISNGKLIVTHVGEFYDGSSDEGWEKRGNPNQYFRITVADAGTYVDGSIKCNQFEYANVTNNNTNIGITVATVSTNQVIGARPSNYLDLSLEDWKTQLATNPLQVIYELVTPLVYDFNPLNLRSNGVTNISVDCGEVTELKYFSETP